MKVFWEASDIKPGMVVGKPDRIERFIVAYDPRIKGLSNLSLVSLSDGMVVRTSVNASDMANILNEDNELPVRLLDKS